MRGTIQAALFDEGYLRSTFASLLGISAAHVALSTQPASTHVMSLLVITLATTAEAGPILTSIQEAAAEALRTNFTQIDGLSDVMCLNNAPPPSPPPTPPPTVDLEAQLSASQAQLSTAQTNIQELCMKIIFIIWDYHIQMEFLPDICVQYQHWMG